MKRGKDGWLELDPQTDMNDRQREAYEAYKAKYAEARMARNHYESLMIALAPAGKAFVFGYNFGKASIKVVDASEVRQPKAAKATQSLADFLEGEAGSGREC